VLAALTKGPSYFNPDATPTGPRSLRLCDWRMKGNKAIGDARSEAAYRIAHAWRDRSAAARDGFHFIELHRA